MSVQLNKTLKSHLLTVNIEVNVKIDLDTNLNEGGYCKASINKDGVYLNVVYFNNNITGWRGLQGKLNTIYKGEQDTLDKKAKNLIEFEAFSKMAGFESL